MKPKLLFLFILPVFLFSCKKKEDQSPPRLTTVSPSQIKSNSARSGGGSIDDRSVILNKGVCWSDHKTPDIQDSKTSDGEGNSDFSSTLTGLLPNTVYYVRAYATNEYGTGYGEEVTLTTALAPILPIMSTGYPGSVTRTSAVCGGVIQLFGDAQIDSVGICWGTQHTPTKKENVKLIQLSGSTSFTASLVNLVPNTTYYIRTFAATPYGTVYGNEILVKTCFGTVSDYDGNTYYTVKIGGQEWMAENLRVTHFNDGSLIPHVTNDNAWSSTSQPAYCSYNNIPSDIFGKLYNWYCATNTKNIAPAGWHVATINDWNILATTLGGADVACNKIKMQGDEYWHSPSGTNESGMSVVGAGFRDDDAGYFDWLLQYSYFWINGPDITDIPVSYGSSTIAEQQTMSSHNYGFSIRCIKD